LVNNNTGNLLAIPFDLDSLEVKGGSVPLLEGIGAHAISDSGTLIYVPRPAVAAGAASAASSANTLVWVDRQGKEEPLGAAPDDYRGLKISPDGTKVALSIAAAGNQDIGSGHPHKIPTKEFRQSRDTTPVWTSMATGFQPFSLVEQWVLYWPVLRGRAACFQARQGIFPMVFPTENPGLNELTLSPA
jgi:hypothetical protein